MDSKRRYMDQSDLPAARSIIPGLSLSISLAPRCLGDRHSRKAHLHQAQCDANIRHVPPLMSGIGICSNFYRLLSQRSGVRVRTIDSCWQLTTLAPHRLPRNKIHASGVERISTVSLTFATAVPDSGSVTEITCFCTKLDDTIKKISSKKTTSIRGVISM